MLSYIDVLLIGLAAFISGIVIGIHIVAIRIFGQEENLSVLLPVEAERRGPDETHF